jgi:hypothetical protein
MCTLYTIKLKNMYTTFLLFFFQIFKVYSRQVSSSVAGICLFAKGEVKNVSKVDWTSLVEWPDRLCLLLYVSARIH